jgi:dihydroorotate dehydrogenase (NAD+) catalytic subunit
MVNLEVNIAGIKLKNPVMTASGTFGYGEEFSDFYDISKLGAIVIKGITLESRAGNKPPRMAETPSGMLNAVGLQNKGVDYVIEHYFPQLEKMNIPVIVNINGSNQEDYLAVAEKLKGQQVVSALELNISCPNVKQGGMAFGVDPKAAADLTYQIKQKSDKPVIVKLSPNVTDIVEIAVAVESAGADALSLINTVLGMAVDIKTKSPKLSTITGGLSGPAVKPIALRMVWQVAQKTKLPIIGMGGISTWQDALEFIIAGATAVAVGTANFINPQAALEMIGGIAEYLEQNNISSIEMLRGSLKTV